MSHKRVAQPQSVEHSYLEESETIVFQEERQRIEKRRKEQFPNRFPPTPAGANGTSDWSSVLPKSGGQREDRAKSSEASSQVFEESPVPEGGPDFVGLSLSGGGVRSAAFSLGILQSLHRYGVLRFVDYLSAVSGGTYAAGMLIKSLSSGLPYEHQRRSEFPLAVHASGKNADWPRQVSRRGNYLFRLDLFLSRFIPNTLLNLLPGLLLLCSVGSGIAFVWRCLDYERVRDQLAALALGGDAIPAFVPAIATALLWMMVHLLGRVLVSTRLKRLSNVLLWTTVATLLIALAILLGNGDISFRPAGDDASVDVRHQSTGVAWKIFISLVTIGCGIPLLLPNRILKSGAEPQKWFDSWFFYYTSFALFVGVPLLSVAWFGQENISGFNTYRDGRIMRGDLVSDPAFTLLENNTLRQQPVLFKDINLVVTYEPQVPGDEWKGWRDARREFLNAQDALQTETTFPPIDIKKSTGESGEFLHREMKEPTQEEWIAWRYPRLFRPLYRWTRPLHITFFDPDYDAYAQYIEKKRTERHELEQRLIRFNDRMERWFLFSVNVPGDAKYVEIATTPKSLKQFLARTSESNINRSPGTATVGLFSSLVFPTQQGLATKPVPISSETIPDQMRLPEKRDCTLLNRELLEVMFSEIIRPRGEIRRANVVEFDQIHRGIWCLASAVLAFLTSWLVNPNKTSLHGYYRDRLSATYLAKDNAKHRMAYPPADFTELEALDLTDRGAPYVLFNASTVDASPLTHAEHLETPFSPFLLSGRFIGNQTVGYARTGAMDHPKLTLADAMAISGAAINPAYFVHHIVTLMMNVINLRTGQLIQNPRSLGHRVRRLSMWRRFIDMLHSRPDEAEHLLLTDGGYVDNLGIEPLLLRRCKLIIVSDSGQDGDHSLGDLAKVIQRMESEHGIRISDISSHPVDSNSADGVPVRIPKNLATPLGSTDTPAGILERRRFLDALASGEPDTHKCPDPRHFFIARIVYPECGIDNGRGQSELPALEGRLIYIKPSISGDEGLQVLNYARTHVEFPHESTMDQAFDEQQFEAYRILGFHSGLDLCRHLHDPEVNGQGRDRPGDASSMPDDAWMRGWDIPWLIRMLVNRNIPGWQPTNIEPVDSYTTTVEGDFVSQPNQAEATTEPWNSAETAKARRQVAEILMELEVSDSASDEYKQAVQRLWDIGKPLEVAADLLVRSTLKEPDRSLLFDTLASDLFGDGAVGPLASVLQTSTSSKEIDRALEYLKDLPAATSYRVALDALVGVALKPDSVTLIRKAIDLLYGISRLPSDRVDAIRALGKVSSYAKHAEARERAEAALEFIEIVHWP